MSIRRNPHYTLGTIINGRTYVYVALGIFKSAQAAAERCTERGALVFEQWDVFAPGRSQPFGLTEAMSVATCLGNRSRD